MVKVSIKKNVKPKTIKQKQRQTQKQNVTVNIGTGAIKKRRRQTKKAQVITKKTQPINQQSIQTFNTPVFKQPSTLVSQPVAQPSTLASSILATQEQPNIVAKEIKQETSLQKALIEQSTNTEEAKSKINELEKSKKETARAKRIEKLDKVMLRPMDDAFKMTSYENDQPIRRALFNQHLADQGDDTEEINNLMVSSRTGGGLLSATSSIPNPLYPLSKVPNLLSSISSSRVANYLDSFLDEENPQPKPQPSEPLSNQQQKSPPTILESFEEESKEELPEEQRFGYIGGVEESKNSEPPEPEPIILKPPEPEPTILKPPEPEPKILKPPEPEPTILKPPEPEPKILKPPEPEPTILKPPEPEPTILEPVKSPLSILLPENKMVLHEQNKVGRILPPFFKPDLLLNPLPPIYLEEPISFAEKLKEKRNKKPLLAIEAQTTQGEAEDTIKLLENLLNPNKNASIPTFMDEEMNTDSPALTKLKNIISDKNFTRKDLVELLAKNNITEKDGLKYAIYKKNIMLGSKSVLKQNLTEHILDAFNEGKITIF